MESGRWMSINLNYDELRTDFYSVCIQFYNCIMGFQQKYYLKVWISWNSVLFKFII